VIIRGEDQGWEGHALAPIIRVRRIPHISTTEREHARRRFS
jgi:hypothetical protein